MSGGLTVYDPNLPQHKFRQWYKFPLKVGAQWDFRYHDGRAKRWVYPKVEVSRQGTFTFGTEKLRVLELTLTSERETATYLFAPTLGAVVAAYVEIWLNGTLINRQKITLIEHGGTK